MKLASLHGEGEVNMDIDSEQNLRDSINPLAALPAVLSPIPSTDSESGSSTLARRGSLRSRASNSSMDSKTTPTANLRKQSTLTLTEESDGTSSSRLRSKSSLARGLSGERSLSVGSMKRVRLPSARKTPSLQLNGDADVNDDPSEARTDEPMENGVSSTTAHDEGTEVGSGDVSSDIPDAAPRHAGPPPIEIAFSFDTTGSMSQCIEQVQAQVQDIIQRLFMDIPNLKIAVIAHGDYCDEEHFYVTQHVDLTNDVASLCGFVKNVGGTGGGDWEECYEFVLQKVRTELSWSPGTRRALVMIGDAAPHPFGPESHNIDWKEEADKLYKELDVRVYGVQCLSEEQATPFWNELAARTHGKHLKLDQFATIVHTLMAIVYREHGPDFFEAYEREVRLREGSAIRTELDTMFHTLRNGQASSSGATTVLASSRFIKGAAKRRPAKTPASRPRKTTPKKVEGKNVAKKPKIANTTAKAPKVVQNKGNAKNTTVSNKKGLQRREVVSHKDFALKGLKWSSWKSAMASAAPGDADGWIPRRQGQPGFRVAELFRDNSKPAVFEFAVQPAPRRKLYTVDFRVTPGIRAGCRWDRHLLNSKMVLKQISSVISQPTCTLFVRRALLPTQITIEGQTLKTVADFRTFLVKTYDFAWRCGAGRAATTRRVRRMKCTLSEELSRSDIL